ncbi:MAG: lantibiotic immunity transporter MutE/EpiE family permease subunit [Lacrimispora sp.]|jgi:ABC-2 type transport system permease protein|nr:lantibiotic immunity transporter MutE/EpiE family permease subunit [Lacrimispora sp.]
MNRITRSELLKTRHTFVKLALFLFPLLTIALAIFLLSGNMVQISAYNWWYVLIMPATFAIICISVIQSDQKMDYINLRLLPLQQTRLYFGKFVVTSFYLCLTNLFLFLGSLLSGFLCGRQFDWYIGLEASIILTVTYLWQIPLCFLSIEKAGTTITFVTTLLLNLVMSSQPIAASDAWLIPYAIPARLMAPLIKVNPNGIPLADNSFLNDSTVIIPGILTSLMMLCLTTWVMNWYISANER